MSTPYERVKGGKLTFKGGLGPEKAIKKAKKHKKKVAAEVEGDSVPAVEKQENNNTSNTNPVSTIDPTSRKNYEELFPVEAKKFGFAGVANPKKAEEALNERVKKKADRYCK
ncbi:uncharacterized protein LOC131076790 [Cryptomeria japonica]|uniref:uncharacterized protein LOC131076790 n=1 Tax=Cryptomeria japonica TaxID=3369 RepID=UPI0025AC42DE|nr:uncharacterized protein LOC131076790 [Cryptomeria japonica]